MAKRKRTISLDGLVSELSSLDARRKELVNQIQTAVGSAISSIGTFIGSKRRGRPAGSKNAAPVARKKRKMSAKARKAISDAQKRRWAKQKAGAK